MEKIFSVALIPGDGIGREVLPEGVRVMEAAARKHGFGAPDLFVAASEHVSGFHRVGGEEPPVDQREVGSHVRSGERTGGERFSRQRSGQPESLAPPPARHPCIDDLVAMAEVPAPDPIPNSAVKTSSADGTPA